jgi:hypothetical protein
MEQKMPFDIRNKLIFMLIYFVLLVNAFGQNGDYVKRQYFTYTLDDIVIDVPSDMFVITKSFATNGIDKLPLGLPVNEIQELFGKQNIVLYALSSDLNSSIEITVIRNDDDSIMGIDFLSESELSNLIESIIAENKRNMIERSFKSVYKSPILTFLIFEQYQTIEFLVVSKQYYAISNGIKIAITFYPNLDCREEESVLQKHIIDSLLITSKY